MDWKAVRNGYEISKKIADMLEEIDPAHYNGSNRAEQVRRVNDHLQGREKMPLDTLLDRAALADAFHAGEVKAIRTQIQDFQAQKALLDRPYTKSSGKQYNYRSFSLDPDRSLKIVNQRLYDQAARAGFPQDFFRESYFDRVTLYCLPEQADCNFSYFDRCSFQVCRINGATFDGARLDGCEFHTARLDHVTFFAATLSYTHFHDSGLNWVSFQKARLKSCNTIDCTLQNVGFLNAVLDGCFYGRVTAEHTRCLHTAVITQGGATAEECAENRAALLRSLCPQRETAPRHVPEKRRGSK